MGDDNSDVDVELLTEEIKTRRKIWDIRNEHYKDRIKKHSAWEKICGLLIKVKCPKPDTLRILFSILVK
jgi:hypothetical protein